ncbi:MAG: Gmad2 immunoglobulin-like domain-containing protein [Dermatophilaceae bacterium]
MGQLNKPDWRSPAACLMGLALATTLAGCGSTGGTGTAGATTSATSAGRSSAPTGTAATSTSGKKGSVPVYWLGESRRTFALYREFRAVPDKGGPVSSAVSAMMTLQPLDPDYLTPWRHPSRVAASQTGDVITVDLSADAFANNQVGSELAERAIQQLVYTATAAAQQSGASARSVKILVDGGAFDAWGAVQLGKAMSRAPMTAVQAHTWVTSPQEGEVLSAGIATFKGFGTSFEANFLWQIRDGANTVVAKGFATGGGGDGTFGELTFTAPLKAGTYSVKVSDDDASGGAEGPGAATDDKSFTVR